MVRSLTGGERKYSNIKINEKLFLVHVKVISGPEKTFSPCYTGNIFRCSFLECLGDSGLNHFLSCNESLEWSGTVWRGGGGRGVR